MLSLQSEPGRESPWLGTLLAAAELALEAAGLRASVRHPDPRRDLDTGGPPALPPELAVCPAPFAPELATLALATHFLGGMLLTPAARRTLVARDWPGNARELAATVAAARQTAAAAGREAVDAPDLDTGAAT